MQANTEQGAGGQVPRFMYVGPHVIGAGLLHGAVYKQQIPPYLNAFFGQCRAIKQLFVELNMEPGKSNAAAALMQYERHTGRAWDLCEEVNKWQAAKHQHEVKREFPIGVEAIEQRIES